MRFGRFHLLPLVGLLLSGGCASEPAGPSWADQAQADPAGFNPRMEKQDISGGGLTDFDKKAFRKDVDHVLNP